MKARVLLFAMVLIFISALDYQAQELDGNRLTVYGKVRVFAKADRATVTFNIKGVGRSLQLAFNDANKQINAIAERLHAIGLSEGNLSTSFFRSSENFGDKAFLSSKRDYRAIMTACITTDSLELLESIVVILSESEVRRIANITFELINYSEVRKDAMARAIDKAKEKAELISRQLGIRSGNIIEIEELKSTEPQNPWIYPLIPSGPFNAPLVLSSSSRSENPDNSGIFAQEIRFDSEVRLVYEILDDTEDIEIGIGE